MLLCHLPLPACCLPEPVARLRVVLLWAGACLVCLCSSAAELYVSPSGADEAPGTFSEPFATIQHAAEVAQPGDTIFLREGTYRESVDFGAGAGHSGAAGAEIVVHPFEDENATLSAFEILVPERDGAGTWIQHDDAIWKISVPPSWPLTVGNNLIMVDGVVKQEARWPNVTEPFSFDYREMAMSESGTSDPDSAGPQSPYSGDDFYTGTYLDPQLPPVANGAWRGARIDLNPGGGNVVGTGIVTNNSGSTLDFRYNQAALSSPGEAEPYYLWNHLAALDHDGEAFLDVEGVSGPPNTLYLWSPEGDPSLRHTVEIRTRTSTLRFRDVSHLRLERLVSLGGQIDARPISSFITLRELTARYAGAGLNRFQSATAIVNLEGTDSALIDSNLGPGFGGGVRVGGTNNRVENNVIRRCQYHGVATWGGLNLVVHRNTIAENGASNVAMFSRASEFTFNRCYLAGLRATDIASMNTNGSDVDMLNSEVAYNWVHDNVARRNHAKGLVGGKGIRVDSGMGGVHNMMIHHNIVWRINGDAPLVLWALPPTSTAYGNSRIRVHNNTLRGEIKFQGTGSIGGHDVRNNIADKLVLVGSGKETATVTHNLLSNQGFNAPDWPGNIFAPPNFVAGASADFNLLEDSPACDAAAIIAPLTDGYAGPAPDVGAIEHLGPHARSKSAGAVLLPKDLTTLAIAIEVTATGKPELRITNLPEGRILPDGFALRLGEVVTNHLFHEYSIRDHHATGIVKFPTSQPADGPQALSLSLDAGAKWIPMGTLEVPPPGVSIKPGSLPWSDPAGGTTARLEVNGFLSKQKLIPIDIVRTLPGDLTSNPVPLVMDTRDLIASGEINPDGSNIRFRNFDKSEILDYWIESGLNSASTLFWLRYKPGQVPNGDQLYLAIEAPSSPSVSDQSVVTSRYRILEDPALAVWYSANSLPEPRSPGHPIELLPDRGPRGLDASQPDPGSRPQWNGGRLGGLPTLSFDGDDCLFSATLNPGPMDEMSFVIIYRNELSTDPTARIISSGDPGEDNYSSSGPAEGTFTMRATRRVAQNLANFTIGRKTNYPMKFFNGEIAEIMVFDEHLENGAPGRWELAKEFASRKYGLANEARAVARPEDTIHPATLFVGGQQIHDFTIHPDGSLEFTIPPSPAGSLIPQRATIEIVSGHQTISLPDALTYYIPNYHRWSAPLAAVGLDAPDLDLDGDRSDNLIEYLLDLDPSTPDIGGIRAEEARSASGEKVLHLTFRRSTTATDALLLIESSSDLKNWSPLTTEDLSAYVLDPDPDADGSAVLYRAELPVRDHGELFFRLKGELLLP